MLVSGNAASRSLSLLLCDAGGHRAPPLGVHQRQELPARAPPRPQLASLGAVPGHRQKRHPYESPACASGWWKSNNLSGNEQAFGGSRQI